MVFFMAPNTQDDLIPLQAWQFRVCIQRTDDGMEQIWSGIAIAEAFLLTSGSIQQLKKFCFWWSQRKLNWSNVPYLQSRLSFETKVKFCLLNTSLCWCSQGSYSSKGSNERTLWPFWTEREVGSDWTRNVLNSSTRKLWPRFKLYSTRARTRPKKQRKWYWNFKRTTRRGWTLRSTMWHLYSLHSVAEAVINKSAALPSFHAWFQFVLSYWGWKTSSICVTGAA